MKISTKGRYALRLLIDLARQEPDRYVPLKEIADRQKISRKYLEQIVLTLSAGDLLQTSRGTRGGYRLARPAASYTVGEILRLTEGDLSPVFCVASPGMCARSEDCATRRLWQGLSDVVREYLDSVTLASLVCDGAESQMESADCQEVSL